QDHRHRARRLRHALPEQAVQPGVPEEPQAACTGLAVKQRLMAREISMRTTVLLFAALSALATTASAADASLSAEIDRLAEKVQAHVVENRRYIHQHPELSNREVETAKYIAKKLKALGLEVQTGIARTGVVGVLKGGLPGRVVALRS